MNMKTIEISTISDLGKAVRDDRNRRHMTQTEFASLCGVGQDYISELENGKATMEIGKVLSIVIALGFMIKLER